MIYLFYCRYSLLKGGELCGIDNCLHIICYGEYSRSLYLQVVRQIQIRQIAHKETPKSCTSWGFRFLVFFCEPYGTLNYLRGYLYNIPQLYFCQYFRKIFISPSRRLAGRRCFLHSIRFRRNIGAQFQKDCPCRIRASARLSCIR